MSINGLAQQNQTGAERVCLLVRFRVWGDMRFLSHAETMRVFQRSCARAGVRIAHSEGFNPHPRLSLVLPRSVGVESDDELLCLWLQIGQVDFDVESLKSQMPQGIEIISANVSMSKKAPEPAAVKYLLKVKDQGQKLRLKRLIEELSAKNEIIVERRFGQGRQAKFVDVRPFLKSINEEGAGFCVDCAVSPSGTIRVDEILGLLQLKIEDLVTPVMRLKVEWKGLEDN